MKIIFRNIHLYLSLAAGLVIMSCCFSGAILVFEKELQEGFNKHRYFVQEQPLHLPLEHLVTNVKSKFASAKISSVRVYTNPKRSVEIGVSLADDDIGTKPQKSAVKIDSNTDFPLRAENNKPLQPAARTNYTAFVNPYSGEVIELYNYRKSFFFTMFSLHRWLLGSDSGIGKNITGIATFIFLFIISTGIILWWPRNKAILKQRLKLKTNANFKRFNHDLHIVAGFYAAIFLFIFAFTALAWSFKWFNKGIYAVSNSSMKPAEVPLSVYQPGKRSINYDAAFITLTKITNKIQFYILRPPNDSAASFSAILLPVGAHESASDVYYLDQYSGQVISTIKFRDRNVGQRIRSTFKPVHTGSIFGLPSKIIALLVCLVGVTLPITGTIMWINRIWKKK